MIATHLLAAGAIGATIEPIKWAMGAGLALASAAGHDRQALHGRERTVGRHVRPPAPRVIH